MQDEEDVDDSGDSWGGDSDECPDLVDDQPTETDQVDAWAAKAAAEAEAAAKARREAQAAAAAKKKAAEAAKKPAGLQKGFLGGAPAKAVPAKAVPAKAAPAKATNGAARFAHPFRPLIEVLHQEGYARCPACWPAGTHKASKPKSKAGLIEDVSDEDSGMIGVASVNRNFFLRHDVLLSRTQHEMRALPFSAHLLHATLPCCRA